ncbi:MAG: amidohydrolase family protein [Pararhodobacter sp.]
MHVYLDGFAAQPGGPGLPPGRAGAAEYRQVMDWLGLERVVVTQGNAHQFDNANLLTALAEFGDIARGVAVVTGATRDAELEALHAAGVRGARVMDLPGGAVGLARLAEVDARARSLDWVLAVQFDGTHLRTHLPRLEAVKSRFIIDHHGKFFDGIAPGDPRIEALKHLIDRGNCWFKLAGCYESSRAGGPEYADVGAVAREIVAHAPERVIWGTNWPHNAASTPEAYPDDAALLDLLLDWAPDPAWQRQILVDTPTRLFGF